MKNVLLICFFLAFWGQKIMGSSEFTSAQEAIVWAQANRTLAAELTHITITGNNDESDMLKLSRLNNNSGSGLFRSLESIELSGQTGSIPNSCFYTHYTGALWLKRFSAPNLTGIGSWAFRFCSALSEVELPSVTHIDAFAFYNSGLSRIHLPVSLSSVGENPFLGCKDLSIISIDAGNESFATEDNVLYSVAKDRLLAYANGRNHDVFSCSDKVRSVGCNAFGVCNNLLQVELPAVTEIKDWAFEHCEGLEKIKLKSFDAIDIQKNAFSQVTTTNIHLYLNVDGKEYQNNVNANLWKELGWKSITGEYSTGIEDIKAYSVSFYPSPVQDILYIKSDSPISNVMVFDMNTRLMLQTQYTDKGIEMSALPEGIYIVKIITESGEKSERIIKVH